MLSGYMFTTITYFVINYWLIYFSEKKWCWVGICLQLLHILLLTTGLVILGKKMYVEWVYVYNYYLHILLLTTGLYILGNKNDVEWVYVYNYYSHIFSLKHV